MGIEMKDWRDYHTDQIARAAAVDLHQGPMQITRSILPPQNTGEVSNKLVTSGDVGVSCAFG